MPTRGREEWGESTRFVRRISCGNLAAGFSAARAGMGRTDVIIANDSNPIAGPARLGADMKLMWTGTPAQIVPLCNGSRGKETALIATAAS